MAFKLLFGVLELLGSLRVLVRTNLWFTLWIFITFALIVASRDDDEQLDNSFYLLS